MRRILLLAVALSCLIATSGCSGLSLGPLDDFLNDDRLDEATVAAGLRDALTMGTTRAARTLSKPGAFADDARFRIELPEKLDPVRKALDLVGYARVMDEFEVAMNDAAGLAAGEAVSVFGDVISTMSIQDAWDILRGPDDAATRYLEEHASPRLRRRFAPVIAQAMRESGVYSLYADIQKRVVALQPEIFGMLANRQWLMRDYVKGFVYCPLRLTGEMDLYPMWVDAA